MSATVSCRNKQTHHQTRICVALHPSSCHGFGSIDSSCILPSTRCRTASSSIHNAISPTRSQMPESTFQCPPSPAPLHTCFLDISTTHSGTIFDPGNCILSTHFFPIRKTLINLASQPTSPIVDVFHQLSSTSLFLPPTSVFIPHLILVLRILLQFSPQSFQSCKDFLCFSIPRTTLDQEK